MKQSIWLQLGTAVLVLISLAFCKPQEPVPEFEQRQDSLYISELRALSGNPLPNSVYIRDAGMQGLFLLDVADKTSADNMGTILTTQNNYRFRRTYVGAASLLWFGGYSSSSDIGPALETTIRATSELFIPDGNYTQLTAVHLKSNFILRANAGKMTINLPKSHASLIKFVNADDPTVSLEHVLIDGLSWSVNSKEKGAYGPISIDGPSVTDLTIQNCTSTDVSPDSTNWLTLKIQAARTASNIIVRNNNIQSKRMGCEIFNHDNFNTYAGKNITVSGNTFHDCWFGISLSGPLETLLVDNNYIKNCSQYGIEIAGAARKVTINNNQFEGTFDKFLEGSNDGSGNGTIVGGMVITNNVTVGFCKGGVQLYNGGAVTFRKNTFRMTGTLEVLHSTTGGLFTENYIETTSNKAIICDNTPNNTFTGNTISNKTCPINQATFMAYGSNATNNILTNNRLIQGNGGKPYDSLLGGSCQASQNFDEAGNPIP